jgi:hypothetical protein
VRYVIKLRTTLLPDEVRKFVAIARRFGLEARRLPGSPTIPVMEVMLEKGDPRLEDVQEALRSQLTTDAGVFYEAAFDKAEVETAELLQLVVDAVCGPEFAEWTRDSGMPKGLRVIDKRQMGSQDIALTFLFEVVISEKLKSILEREHLSGWEAFPVSHIDATQSHLPPFFHLVATNQLPPFAEETEVHLEYHRTPLRWPVGHPLHGTPDPLAGTTGLFQRGPLTYHRSALGEVQDFNFTNEQFGEETQKHPEMLASQRAWRAFQRHRIRNVNVEPVEILG